MTQYGTRNETHRKQALMNSKRRKLIVSFTLIAALVLLGVLVYFSATHEPESNSGLDTPVAIALALGTVVIVTVGVLLLFRYVRKTGQATQRARMAPLAEWAAARRWRVRSEEELATRSFPDLAGGPRVTPERCAQSIEGEMNGRRFGAESWELEHRNLGAAVSRYVSRPLVRVNASPYLPTVSLGAAKSSAAAMFTGPKQMADRKMTTQGALSHVPAELLRHGMTTHGPFVCFGPAEEAARVVPHLQRFQQAMAELQAWVITSPGEILLTFMEEPANEEMFERRVHLAVTMADDLDRYR